MNNEQNVKTYEAYLNKSGWSKEPRSGMFQHEVIVIKSRMLMYYVTGDVLSKRTKLESLLNMDGDNVKQLYEVFEDALAILKSVNEEWTHAATLETIRLTTYSAAKYRLLVEDALEGCMQCFTPGDLQQFRDAISPTASYEYTNLKPYLTRNTYITYDFNENEYLQLASDSRTSNKQCVKNVRMLLLRVALCSHKIEKKRAADLSIRMRGKFTENY